MALEPKYQQQLDGLAQAVSVPLKDGLVSFYTVSEMLLTVEGCIIDPESQLYHDIRKYIVDADEKLDRAQQIASTRLAEADTEIERLTSDMNGFCNRKSQKENELQNAKSQLQAHECSLQNYRQALERERGYLRDAERKVDEMNRRKQEAEVKAAVGAGLMAIPIFGWIVGGTLLGVSVNEINQASEAASRAQDVVRNTEHQISVYQNKVSEFQSAINKAEGDIQTANRNVQNLENQLTQSTQTRNSIVQVQGKLRSAVGQMDQLCAVSDVAELQTRYLIIVETLMMVMEEMTTALSQISGGSVLHTKDILSLMDKIKYNHEKQKARQLEWTIE